VYFGLSIWVVYRPAHRFFTQFLNIAKTMWNNIDNSLRRSLQFSDFKTAFAFLTEVAAEAERLDHHPWFSNEYNVVEFRLRTHDAGNTVTERDHRLAAAIDAVAARYEVS
jgi:4a-hydroxytetrahydrobiopterin dehydratase